MRSSELEHSHEPEAIHQRINSAPHHSYLADFVYGAIDGTVTTFAVVSGVAGAGLAPEVIIILGLANLMGDGFSMAASNFVGTRTDQQLLAKAREMERRHIAANPEGEREEIRQIFASKGFVNGDLERAVEIITADEQCWVDTMLTEELGLSLSGPSAIKAASTTFFAFVIVGFVPLAVFVWQHLFGSAGTSAFAWSTLFTGITFFGIGASKSRFVDQSWYASGIETLLVGGMASGIAYLIGSALRGILTT